MFVAIYDGPVFYNKASDQEKSAATQNQNFTTELQNQYGQEFGNSQQIQGALNSQLQGIMNRGQAGQGFQPGEEANLRTDATENAAHQAVQGEQALGQQLASHSEGGALTSGGAAQLAEQNTAGAAASNAAAQRGITGENAQLARQNVQQGMSGLSGLSQQMAGQTDATGGMAVNNGANSFNQVTQAYQPSNFWGNLAGGLAGGVVNSFASGAGSLLAGKIPNGTSASDGDFDGTQGGTNFSAYGG